MNRSVKTSTGSIDDFINYVGSIKKAADGTTPISEPGSIGGETTHPVKKVDDRLEKAKEGERSAENSKDVKEDQGAASVESATKAASIFARVGRFAKKAEGAVSTPGSAEDDHISTTMKVAPTGEDPANETNSAKAGKEDKKQGDMGGTKHPASTENNQLDGHKYAADTPLEKLAQDVANIGNRLLTSIHAVYENNGTASKVAAAPAPKQPQQVTAKTAFDVGHNLPGLLSNSFDKKAADAEVHQALVSTIKCAMADADLFIKYADSFLTKKAEGEPPTEAPPEGDMPPGAGGLPPGAGGPPGGEDAMMAALGGGAGAGGPPPGDAGGQPPVDANQVLQILEQMGVSPEELREALDQETGGGAGGPPPGAGGPPPGAGGPPGMEVTASDRRGNHNVKAAATMQEYISELISRSRAKR